MKGLTIKSNLSIKNDSSLLQSRLERLFFCELNSSPGLLGKGSRIPEIIHELSTEEIPKAINNEVAFLIGTYETEITLVASEIILSENEYGSTDVGIYIDFYWNNNNKTDSLSLTYIED